MKHDGLFSWERIVLKLRNPFRISYGSSDTRQAFWIRLAADTPRATPPGINTPDWLGSSSGWGEGTIPAYYGVSDEEMITYWERAAGRTDALPEDPAQIEAWIGPGGPAPARCALDLALHDRLARRAGLPLHACLDLPAPKPISTSFTISLGTPDEMAAEALQAAAYPILKIKLGTDDDVSRLAAVRAARPDARLRVDANAGWQPDEAVRQIAAMERYDLELIEQPVSKADIAGMGTVQRHTSLPVVADESVQTLDNVEALARAGVQGINLKLMKVGGLAPALRILHRARDLGLRIMLGCMIETSLGVTAMAHLSGFAEWVDLDPPLLVSNDPFQGITYDDCWRIQVPDRPGIGVILR